MSWEFGPGWYEFWAPTQVFEATPYKSVFKYPIVHEGRARTSGVNDQRVGVAANRDRSDVRDGLVRDLAIGTSLDSFVGGGKTGLVMGEEILSVGDGGDVCQWDGDRLLDWRCRNSSTSCKGNDGVAEHDVGWRV